MNWSAESYSRPRSDRADRRSRSRSVGRGRSSNANRYVQDSLESAGLNGKFSSFFMLSSVAVAPPQTQSVSSAADVTAVMSMPALGAGHPSAPRPLPSQGCAHVAKLVVVCSGQLLCLYNLKHGGLDFPGGKRDLADSDLWQALRREILEELGVYLEHLLALCDGPAQWYPMVPLDSHGANIRYRIHYLFVSCGIDAVAHITRLAPRESSLQHRGLLPLQQVRDDL